MTKNLNLMVDIETNLEHITDQFRKSGAGIEAQFQATAAEDKKINVDLAQLMSIQMTKAMHQIRDSIASLTQAIREMMGEISASTQAAAGQVTGAMKTTETATKKAMKNMDDTTDEALGNVIEKTEEVHEKMKELSKGPVEDLKDQLDKKKKDSLGKNVTDLSKNLEKGAEEFKGLGKVGKSAGGIISKIFKTSNEGAATAVRSSGLLRTATTNLGKSTFGAFRLGSQGARLFQAALGPIGWILLAIQAAIFAIKAAWKLLVGFVKAQVKLVVLMFKTVVNAIKLMGETMWMVIKGPLAALGKAVKWIIAILGGLSFADAIKGAMELEDAANRIARTMVGGTQSTEAFHRAQSKLMTDIKKSAWEAGASIEDMAAVYEGLAAYHIPVKDLKGLADMSFKAAKGLNMSRDAATQLVAELKHVGRLSGREIKGILNQFATLQQYVGLSAAETQALAKGIIETTRRLKSMGATATLITRYARETNKLAAMFVKVGLDAQGAADLVSRLFDPDQLENNIVLYSKLGMSVSHAMAIMQGAGEIPADMASKFVDIAKQVTAMGPIAGKAYAETMGMSYKMAQQLGSLTRDQVSEVNKVLGKGGDEAGKQLEEQRKRQQEALKEQLEMTRNRMALMWMETLAPMLEFLKGALGGIQQIMSDLMPVVKIISSFIGGIMGQLTKLIKPMTNMISMVADVFLAKESPLFKAIEKIVITVATIIQDLIPIVEEILGTIGGVAFEVIGSVMDTIGSVIKELKPAIMAIAGFIKDIIKPIADIFSKVLKEMQPVFEMVARIAGKILKLFSKILVSLLTKLSKPLTTIVGAISKIILALEKPIETILAAFGKAFDAIAPALTKLAQAVADIFTPQFVQQIESIARTFADVLAKMITKFGDFFKGFVDNLVKSGFFEKLPQILTQVADLLMKFIALKIDKVMHKMTSALTLFQSKGMDLIMKAGVTVLEKLVKVLARAQARQAWRTLEKDDERRAQGRRKFLRDYVDDLTGVAETITDATGASLNQLMRERERALREGEEKDTQETISEELGTLNATATKEVITTKALSEVDQETMEGTMYAMQENVDTTKELNENIKVMTGVLIDVKINTDYLPLMLGKIATNTETSAQNS